MGVRKVDRLEVGMVVWVRETTSIFKNSKILLHGNLWIVKEVERDSDQVLVRSVATGDTCKFIIDSAIVIPKKEEANANPAG